MAAPPPLLSSSSTAENLQLDSSAASSEPSISTPSTPAESQPQPNSESNSNNTQPSTPQDTASVNIAEQDALEVPSEEQQVPIQTPADPATNLPEYIEQLKLQIQKDEARTKPLQELNSLIKSRIEAAEADLKAAFSQMRNAEMEAESEQTRLREMISISQA